MAKKSTGRPLSIDDKVLKKLEEAFSLGCTDLEACLMADISHATLYNYQNKNPSFIERKKALKETQVLKARKVVVDALKDGDTNTAKWYLERKNKDEFSARVEEVKTDETGDAIKGLLDMDLLKSCLNDEAKEKFGLNEE